MPDFVPGLVLAERFYREAVGPILTADFPDLRHAAGLIGTGSEVLGFDTPVSSDHHWGPRAMLFLDEPEHEHHADAVRECLRRNLPHSFLGWPTNFAEPDPTDHGTQLLRATTSGPVNHRVEVLTVRGFFGDYLGADVCEPFDPCDWLTFPSQKLRTITTGPVFHDAIGLGEVRARFTWYPDDVWRWLLAAGWKRIGQEEHLMGRAGQVGDEIGSALIAARLVRDVMRLCFLMERRHAPYAKWFGTAFGGLEAAGALTPLLSSVLRAPTWQERDRTLSEVYAILATQQNALGLCAPLSADTRPFFQRPFTAIFGERFTDALKAAIEDPRLRRIPVDIGGIDQWSDSADLLEATALRRRVKALYAAAD